MFDTTEKRESENRGKFCSRECFFKSRKSNRIVNCVICESEIRVLPSRKIKEGVSCSKECYKKYLSTIASKRVIKGFMDNNRNMKFGCGITTDGYIWIYKNGEYNNQIKLHRYIMEIKLGRRLNSDEIVHHIDENKLNNVIENLQIVTRQEHNKIHKNTLK